jgi:hypothetical protein
MHAFRRAIESLEFRWARQSKAFAVRTFAAQPFVDLSSMRCDRLGMNSLFRAFRPADFYWVPEQYVDAIRQALTGRSFGCVSPACSNTHDLLQLLAGGLVVMSRNDTHSMVQRQRRRRRQRIGRSDDAG